MPVSVMLLLLLLVGERAGLYSVGVLPASDR